MGAGPTPQQVRRAERKAAAECKEFEAKYNVPATARIIRASNGEAAMLYEADGHSALSIAELSIILESARKGQLI